MMRGIFTLLLAAAAATGSVQAQSECFTNLTMINLAESILTSTDERREYQLCPDTTFVTGTIEGTTLVGGQTPLNLRPNVSIRCGEDGSRSNNCVITGGIGLLGTPGNFGDQSLEGVEIQGITFRNLTSVTFFIGPINGAITVTDCAFLVGAAVLW